MRGVKDTEREVAGVIDTEREAVGRTGGGIGGGIGGGTSGVVDGRGGCGWVFLLALGVVAGV